ncbi:MAG: hypothetical protein JW727_03210 [Candidatus Aenigmarchaeota archaeon]|nr:hypothetical protein [Candidatus Aenigmarchaeota archaeon]
MAEVPWLLVAILTLLAVLAVAAVIFRRKDNSPPDYYSFFIMGIVWLAVGLPLAIFSSSYALLLMGIIFTIVGLGHRDEWKKNRKKWEKLKPEERKTWILVLALLGFIVLLAFIAFVVFRWNLVLF